MHTLVLATQQHGVFAPETARCFGLFMQRRRSTLWAARLLQRRAIPLRLLPIPAADDKEQAV